MTNDVHDGDNGGGTYKLIGVVHLDSIIEISGSVGDGMGT